MTALGAAQEPPVSVLMRAAKKMREDAEACGDPPGSFIPAVANWLESEARRADGGEGGVDCVPNLPYMAALAYLGERETDGPS